MSSFDNRRLSTNKLTTDESVRQLQKKVVSTTNDTTLSYDQRVTLMIGKDEAGSSKASFSKPKVNKFYGVYNKNAFPSDQDIR